MNDGRFLSSVSPRLEVDSTKEGGEDPTRRGEEEVRHAMDKVMKDPVASRSRIICLSLSFVHRESAASFVVPSLLFASPLRAALTSLTEEPERRRSEGDEGNEGKKIHIINDILSVT